MYRGGTLPPKSLYSIYTAQGAQCNTSTSYKGHNPRENQTDIRELPENSMCLAPPFVYDVVLWVLKLVQGGSH